MTDSKILKPLFCIADGAVTRQLARWRSLSTRQRVISSIIPIMPQVLSELGNIYTRIMNPTNDVLEQRIAALEGGVAALSVSSGQTATAMSLQNIAHAGITLFLLPTFMRDMDLFANTLPDMGIEVRFVDPSDPQAFENAIDDKTRAIYGNTT